MQLWSAEVAPAPAPAPEAVPPVPVPIPPAPVAATPAPPAAPPTPSPAYITGRLEIKASGASIKFPPGKTEAIIGREDPVSGIFPEIDLDPHGGHDGGVGRKHARLFMQSGQLMVEDQDSVNGTLINKRKLLPFQPLPLNNGDELRLGKVVMVYHAS